MKIVTIEEMKKVERRDYNLRRLSEDDLILSVAMSLEDKIISLDKRNILILCGNNRNGDYGLLASVLLKRDTQLNVTAVSLNTDSKYYQAAESEGVPILNVQRIIKQNTEQADIIVDCICDYDDCTLEYPFNYWVEWINDSHKYVISCDVPSGMNSDNGSIAKNCVRATETLAVQLPKLGCYLYPGSEATGKLTVDQVGLSYEATEFVNTIATSNSYGEIQKKLPLRRKHSHKSTYGKVLLIAGSPGKSGAAILCGKALLKCGAGLLTIMSHEKVIESINNTLFEAMTITMKDGHIRGAMDQLNLNDFSMLVIGPGLGRSNDTEFILETALKSELPCVIDADGLFFLKDHLDLLKSRKALTVITPHLGEYQRIFDYKQDSIVNDLINISKEYDNLAIVLKGEHTLIACQGKITVNTTGNNALAKGGSGDVLCGVIGALLAQRCDIDSVVAGVYIHSYGADKWVENNSSYSLMASDLIEMIDKVLFEMTRS